MLAAFGMVGVMTMSMLSDGFSQTRKRYVATAGGGSAAAGARNAPRPALRGADGHQHLAGFGMDGNEDGGLTRVVSGDEAKPRMLRIDNIGSSHTQHAWNQNGEFVSRKLMISGGRPHGIWFALPPQVQNNVATSLSSHPDKLTRDRTT